MPSLSRRPKVLWKMTPLEILYAMRNLLSTPERWTKGAFARNEDGRSIRISHPHCRAFSLEGSMYRVQWITKAPVLVAHETLKHQIHRGKLISLANFNDARGTTYSAVLDTLDGAIRALGGVPPARVEDDE